ncbi:putative phage abortive infection protein [Enterococcus mundtii]|uniref:Phage abortive infection protein n=1 Tax=Enterococcus mundtii TaxID=53346 RepID=A0A848MWW5_ENTMU|nr:putative phage abortive infection protein [Enterococcus mundtii]NMP58400.1 hypothetical protein [Enterococcus mundtii]
MKAGKKRMNSRDKKWIIYGLFIGIAISFVISLRIYRVGDGWLGFWGGVIGSGIGVLGAFLVLKQQVDEEREQNKRQLVDNTFFNLLAMHNDQINNLKKDAIFISIEDEFKSNLNTCLEAEGYKFFRKNFSIIKNAMEQLKVKYGNYLLEHENELTEEHMEIYEEKWKRNHKSIFTTGVVDSQELKIYSNMGEVTNKILHIEDILNQGIDAVIGSIYIEFNSIKRHAENLKIELPSEFIDFIEILNRYYYSQAYQYISYENRSLVIEEVFLSYYKNIGSYFRLFHRIIKYINDNVEDLDIKNNYLGFLRANVNQNEMLIIFYNAAYTKRGQGLLNELQKTTFFGTEEDIKNNQHFDTDELFWKNDDIGFMLNQENSMND